MFEELEAEEAGDEAKDQDEDPDHCPDDQTSWNGRRFGQRGEMKLGLPAAKGTSSGLAD